jgi:hypothetical protein
MNKARTTAGRSSTQDNVYVVSTMTAGVSYCFWLTIDGLPRIQDKITVRGGANLPSTKDGFGERSGDGEGQPMWTPAGVVTPIRRDRYEKLKEHDLFKKHLALGFVSVTTQDVTDNHKAVKKIVAGMEPADGFAQLTPATYKDRVKITTKTKELEDGGISFNS